ncbi:hypothetical protein ACVINW_004077 [Bradyrhizobium sp. USDA 4461]
MPRDEIYVVLMRRGNNLVTYPSISFGPSARGLTTSDQVFDTS